MRVDQAAANPITAFNNIAYTLHFYADGPNQNYVRGLAQTAYDANIALFVTEWGVGDKAEVTAMLYGTASGAGT